MVANKGKLCLGHCLFNCQTRATPVQRKDFVCDSCMCSKVDLSRVRFSRDPSVTGKKTHVMFDVPFKLYRNVFGDYSMLVFRQESYAGALAEKLNPKALLSWHELPDFFPLKKFATSSSTSSRPSILDLSDTCTWKDGVPFILNTHDHKLVPKPLGGPSGKLAAPVQHRYSCSYCDRTFQQTGNLNSHIRIVHLGQRRFECNICHRKFPRKQNLQYHMRTHTGELPFRCSLCNRGFARKDHLRRHENKAHPYECSVGACKRRFMFKTCVDSHKRVKHGMGDGSENPDDSHQARLFEDDVDRSRRSSTSPNPSESDESESLARSLFSRIKFSSASRSRSRGRGEAEGKSETDSKNEFMALFESVRRNQDLLVSTPSFASPPSSASSQSTSQSSSSSSSPSSRPLTIRPPPLFITTTSALLGPNAPFAALASVAQVARGLNQHRKSLDSLPVAVPLKIEG